MNVLFLTLSRIRNIADRGLYNDLMREFIRNGHQVYIVSPVERRFGVNTCLKEGDGAHILNVKTLNIQKTNILEKGIGTLLLEIQYKRAIHKYWNDVHFDLVLYSTPPITFNKVISSVKKRCGSKSYLLLKDIFPQNAVDLQMFTKNSIFYKSFRKKEETLYQLSDYIGCMSPANVEYLLKHNPSVDSKKVEVCPNCIEPTIKSPFSKTDRDALLQKYNIPSDSPLFIYGGNLGKPQGIDFLIEVLAANEQQKSAHFVIVGSGTEFGKIQHWFDEAKPQHSTLLSSLPKADYDNLVGICDVGLIFLDKRFTIPNYPSRILSYMENKMPILMAVDKNTDIGRIAEENNYGLYSISGDLTSVMNNVKKLSDNESLRESMGNNGYEYFSKHYTVANGYKIIISHFK